MHLMSLCYILSYVIFLNRKCLIQIALNINGNNYILIQSSKDKKLHQLNKKIFGT